MRSTPVNRAEPFAGEQARIVQLLVERVDVGLDGADIRLRTDGLTTVLDDLRAIRRSKREEQRDEPDPPLREPRLRDRMCIIQDGRVMNEIGMAQRMNATRRSEDNVMNGMRIADDGRAVTVRVPLAIRNRGGRKLVIAPDGALDTTPSRRQRIDNAMVKAIARAFRWRELLENGAYATVAEIAAAEKINPSYVASRPRSRCLP